MSICMIHTDELPQSELPNMMLPAWVMDRTVSETLEMAGFGSGAALAILHMTIYNPFDGVPSELLRNYLALEAAFKLQGRSKTRQEIRDAYYLTAPSDDKGPAGWMFLHWRTIAWIGFDKEHWLDTFIDNAPTLKKPFLASFFKNPTDEMIRGNPMTQAIAWARNID